MQRHTTYQRTGMSSAVLAVTATAALGFGVPVASAQGFTDSQIGRQCEVQYPAGAGYTAGVAYLAPPGSASSWRCKQVSDPPGGGAITDLAVDLNAYCQQFGGGGMASASNAADASTLTCN